MSREYEEEALGRADDEERMRQAAPQNPPAEPRATGEPMTDDTKAKARALREVTAERLQGELSEAWAAEGKGCPSPSEP